MPRPFPYDRRTFARPSWRGGADPLEIDEAGWALSPCTAPLCRWLAADGFACLAREASAALADLQRVAAILGHPQAALLANALTLLNGIAEEAGEAAHRASRKAGANNG